VASFQQNKTLGGRPLPSPLPPLPFPPPLDVGHLNPAMGSGECVLALKSDTWLQQL